MTEPLRQVPLARGERTDSTERPRSGQGDGPETPAPRHGGWVRWLVVVALGAAIALSFFLHGGSPAAEAGGTGHGPGAKGAGKPATVRVAPVERRDLTERATYPGEIVSDAVDLSSDVAGRLLEVKVRIGEHVDKGALIARVDAAELYRQRAEAIASQHAADATHQRSLSNLAAAKRQADRTAGLLDHHLVSAQEVDTLRSRVQSLTADAEAAAAQSAEATANAQLLEQKISECRITAPFAGVVSKRYRDPGAYVQPGTPIARIVQQRPLRVQFDVPERDVGALSAAGTVHVHTTAAPDADEVVAHVSGMAGEVDRDRRTVSLEAVIPNPPPTMLPGMFAQVATAEQTLHQVLVVPGAAVLDRLMEDGGTAEGVFTFAGGHAHWVPVRVLGRDGDHMAVDGAIHATDQVLVAGHAELADGAPVRLAAAEKGK